MNLSYRAFYFILPFFFSVISFLHLSSFSFIKKDNMTSFTSHSVRNLLSPHTKRKRRSPRYIRKYNLKALDKTHVTIHSLYMFYWNPSFCTQPLLLLSRLSNTAFGSHVKLKRLPWWRWCLWSGDDFTSVWRSSTRRLQVSIRISSSWLLCWKTGMKLLSHAHTHVWVIWSDKSSDVLWN